MTQRNQNNPRNRARQKHGEGIKGVSKKSAGSARPKRPAAGSVYIRKEQVDKRTQRKREREKEAEEREMTRKRERALSASLTDTPEYKRWRRIWWVLLIIAIIMVVCSFAISFASSSGTLPEFIAQNQEVYSGVTLFIGYGCLIGGILIDVVKIRKMRKNLESQAHSLTRRQMRKLDAAIEASDKQREEERKNRGSRLPWAKKSAPEAAAAAEEKE